MVSLFFQSRYHKDLSNDTIKSIKKIITRYIGKAIECIVTKQCEYAINWPTSQQPNTGKYIFTCASTRDIQPIFSFTNQLFRHLGFNKDSTNKFKNNILESTNVINLQSDNVLFIHSDICSNGDDDILQEVYSEAGNADFSNIHWQTMMLNHIVNNWYQIQRQALPFI
ncbi:hypothetical protein DFA_02649 [Cavenderia fasciculata]|uniref:Uncharacterized protein n=1 Tax=Cavenderia fasciculata TaxID=261658 RepID=F4PZZ6_CACFS|nr:uncharacterized protein DFA_02649 [Cavenderia fasciculata]EGG18910.1 hypothetical protein DFA_02649 [Cavenderia fasciculata]|eukprot:XP_004357372.1 hypothetical protein DFA_02649 [Cavenderia fasciculata]